MAPVAGSVQVLEERIEPAIAANVDQALLEAPSQASVPRVADKAEEQRLARDAEAGTLASNPNVAAPEDFERLLSSTKNVSIPERITQIAGWLLDERSAIESLYFSAKYLPPPTISEIGDQGYRAYQERVRPALSEMRSAIEAGATDTKIANLPWQLFVDLRYMAEDMSADPQLDANTWAWRSALEWSEVISTRGQGKQIEQASSAVDLRRFSPANNDQPVGADSPLLDMQALEAQAWGGLEEGPFPGPVTGSANRLANTPAQPIEYSSVPSLAQPRTVATSVDAANFVELDWRKFEQDALQQWGEDRRFPGPTTSASVGSVINLMPQGQSLAPDSIAPSKAELQQALVAAQAQPEPSSRAAALAALGIDSDALPEQQRLAQITLRQLHGEELGQKLYDSAAKVPPLSNALIATSPEFDPQQRLGFEAKLNELASSTGLHAACLESAAILRRDFLPAHVPSSTRADWQMEQAVRAQDKAQWALASPESSSPENLQSVRYRKQLAAQAVPGEGNLSIEPSARPLFALDVLQAALELSPETSRELMRIAETLPKYPAGSGADLRLLTELQNPGAGYYRELKIASEQHQVDPRLLNAAAFLRSAEISSSVAEPDAELIAQVHEVRRWMAKEEALLAAAQDRERQGREAQRTELAAALHVEAVASPHVEPAREERVLEHQIEKPRNRTAYLREEFLPEQLRDALGADLKEREFSRLCRDLERLAKGYASVRDPQSYLEQHLESDKLFKRFPEMLERARSLIPEAAAILRTGEVWRTVEAKNSAEPRNSELVTR
jgi:hypothetical protein